MGESYPCHQQKWWGLARLGKGSLPLRGGRFGGASRMGGEGGAQGGPSGMEAVGMLTECRAGGLRRRRYMPTPQSCGEEPLGAIARTAPRGPSDLLATPRSVCPGSCRTPRAAPQPAAASPPGTWRCSTRGMRDPGSWPPWRWGPPQTRCNSAVTTCWRRAGQGGREVQARRDVVRVTQPGAWGR